MEFRKLRANEIEVRIDNIFNNYATALIYMEARTPMTLLDEAVGPENWKQEFQFLTASTVMCNLSVYDEKKKEWVLKQDVGSINEGMGKGGDQQKANQPKSATSDALKRAAVMWGIGRELYTSPKIKFSASLINVYKEKYCYDNIICTGINYDELGTINYLQLYDVDTKNILYTYDNRPEELTKDELENIQKQFEAQGVKVEEICKVVGIEKFENFTRSLSRQWFTVDGLKKIKEETQKTLDNLPNTQKGVKEEPVKKESAKKEDLPEDFMDIPDSLDDDGVPFK